MEREDSQAVAEYFNFVSEPPCGTQCVTVGYTRISPRSAYPANQAKHPDEFKSVSIGRSLTDFHLVYIPSGGGRFTDDSGNTATVLPGAIMLLPPGMPHAYSPLPDTGWEEFWVGFKGSYPNWLAKEHAFSWTRPLLSLGVSPELLGDFRQLCLQTTQGANGDRPMQLGGIVNRLIGRLLIMQNRPAQVANEREALAVEKVKSFLDAHLFDDADMRRLPGIAGLKYGDLSQAFKRYTGMTPHQYYTKKKLEKAVLLLRAGKSVKVVSYELGFDCPYYFSRLFSKKMGYAPSLCRNDSC